MPSTALTIPSPWTETTEESFQYSMDCLPPIMINGLTAFMVSEPLRHDPATGRGVYTGFAEITTGTGPNKITRHYTCDGTVAEFKAHYVTLRKAMA